MSQNHLANAPQHGIPYGRLPAAVSHAREAWIHTEDGRDYIDLGNMYGAVILGHGHARVNNAVQATLQDGLQACGGHPLAHRLATQLCTDTGETAHAAALFKTGTDAVQALAEGYRSARGKHYIATAGYHGWHSLWTPSDRPFTVSARGVFDCWFVPDQLHRFLDEHAAECAVVVISPDYVHLPPDTLRALFAVAREHEVPVVSDEVKWGYRRSLGPSVHAVGLQADAYVFSKAISNGWPVAAAVGPAQVMQHLARCASTLTFETSSVAAALETLDVLREGTPHSTIEREAGRFLAKAREYLRTSGLPVELVGPPHLFQFVLQDARLEHEFHEITVRNGLLLVPGDNQTPCAAFQGSVVDVALERLERSFTELAALRPEILGTPLSVLGRRRCAFNQMEGLMYAPDDPAQQVALLQDLLNE